MDTVSYPHPDVASFIARCFVPLKVRIKENRELAEQYGVNWTPRVSLVDEWGLLHYRIEGFRPPEDLRGRLQLGLGRHWFDRQAFDRSIAEWSEVAAGRFRPEIAAEALYWLGVASYKASGNPARLLEHWKKLLREHRESEWARAANLPRQKS